MRHFQVIILKCDSSHYKTYKLLYNDGNYLTALFCSFLLSLDFTQTMNDTANMKWYFTDSLCHLNSTNDPKQWRLSTKTYWHTHILPCYFLISSPSQLQFPAVFHQNLCRPEKRSRTGKRVYTAHPHKRKPACVTAIRTLFLVCRNLPHSSPSRSVDHNRQDKTEFQRSAGRQPCVSAGYIVQGVYSTKTHLMRIRVVTCQVWFGREWGEAKKLIQVSLNWDTCTKHCCALSHPGICKWLEKQWHSFNICACAPEQICVASWSLVLTTIIVFPPISGIDMDQLEDERSPGHDPSPPG